ncbi:cupin domain-containing protein [Ketobacter sp.]|uniref:cupin domain-containing protein n=1 Tax=Ketobacter sp. TaxID=2083498 RepID=UPI0025C5E0EB|nr:cupin domain-containing protein [Ketobacter sp.]
MDDFDKSLVVNVMLEQEALLARHQWEPLAEGVFIATLYASGEEGPRAALLHYLPGARVANHLHRGFEHILILHGSQQDGAVTYGVGDLVIHRPGTGHDILSVEGCIALGIWEKPVQF